MDGERTDGGGVTAELAAHDLMLPPKVVHEDAVVASSVVPLGSLVPVVA
jgi:hypothetical protein